MSSQNLSHPATSPGVSPSASPTTTVGGVGGHPGPGKPIRKQYKHPSGWSFVTERSHILTSTELDELKDSLQAPLLPEMVFGRNKVFFFYAPPSQDQHPPAEQEKAQETSQPKTLEDAEEYCSSFCIEVNAVDALRCWIPVGFLPPIEVSTSKQWSASTIRSSFVSSLPRQSFDWTFTTMYSSTFHLGVTSNAKILKRLKAKKKSETPSEHSTETKTETPKTDLPKAETPKNETTKTEKKKSQRPRLDFHYHNHPPPRQTPPSPAHAPAPSTQQLQHARREEHIDYNLYTHQEGETNIICKGLGPKRSKGLSSASLPSPGSSPSPSSVHSHSTPPPSSPPTSPGLARTKSSPGDSVATATIPPLVSSSSSGSLPIASASPLSSPLSSPRSPRSPRTSGSCFYSPPIISESVPAEQFPNDQIQKRENVLFYDELYLFEDELADNGQSICQVRFRVMASCFLLLVRFWLRVDNVLYRSVETRIVHIFDDHTHDHSPEKKKGVELFRQFQIREGPYADVEQQLANDQKQSLSDPNIFIPLLPVQLSLCERIFVPFEALSPSPSSPSPPSSPSSSPSSSSSHSPSSSSSPSPLADPAQISQLSLS